MANQTNCFWFEPFPRPGTSVSHDPRTYVRVSNHITAASNKAAD